MRPLGRLSIVLALTAAAGFGTANGAPGVAVPTPSGSQLQSIDGLKSYGFIVDYAGLLSESDIAYLNELCAFLLFDKAVPLMVVTMESKAHYGGNHMTFDDFARQLYDQWGIGHLNREGVFPDRGILLIISTGDEIARIELGPDWSPDHERTCKRIMRDQIVFYLRRGHFANGILSGVQALDYMAREVPQPPTPRPLWHYIAFGAGVLLTGLTAISLVVQGVGGWGWHILNAIFSLLGLVLWVLVAFVRYPHPTRL